MFFFLEIRIVVLGVLGVGKSSTVSHFMDGFYSQKTFEIYDASYFNEIMVENVYLNFRIFHTNETV